MSSEIYLSKIFLRLNNYLKNILITFVIFSAVLCAQRVDYIEYSVLPVFDEEGEYWGPYDYRWAYKILNDLHIRSRPSAVRRFLAFDIGDTLDPEIIIESERRLRGTNFIGEAEIESERRDSGNVAIVTVTDLWTTKLAPSFSYKGQVVEWGLEFEEVNFLGLGFHLRAGFDHDEDYDSWIFAFDLPRILPGRSSFGFSH